MNEPSLSAGRGVTLVSMKNLGTEFRAAWLTTRWWVNVGELLVGLA